MPLPKPPSKKGDLLQSADYEAQAAPRPDKRTLKPHATESAASQATLTLTNRTTQQVTINTISLTGSADFSILNAPDLPFTLNAGTQISLTLRHEPTSSERRTGTLSVNSTVGTANRTVLVNLVGTAAEFVYSYTPQGGNATNIATGASIVFPATAVDTVTTALVVVTNRGTAQGTVQSIAINGAVFAGVGLPLPNTAVEAGRDLRFTVQFAPRSLDQFQGTLTVITSDRQATFRLEGQGTGAQLTYTANGEPVRPGASIAVPEIAVGERSSAVVTVRNSGNAEARIATLAISGAGFSLADAPLLPLTLAVGGQISFTINFQPTSPGRATARLRVNADDFDVVSNGLGASLTYSYTVGTAPTSVASGGTVNFSPAAVGASSTLSFTVTNSGTSPAAVNAIGLTAASTVFVVARVPALPARLAAGESLSFAVQFIPTQQGASTATLRIDNASFTLSGFGNAPAALPAVRFEGASGAQDALQQPAVGLSIASAYALPVTGVLTLAFNSDVFANDPSVQFATGGRTVNFTIPAGQTRAVFPNGANTIRLQTGSVAGAIVLSATFATEGGINLTPSTVPTLTLTVAPAAPRLLSVILGSKTASGITLLISGYSTARSVTQLDLTFAAISGENLGTQRLTVPVEPAFLGYYQGAASAPYGSLFTLSVPLTLSGDVNAAGTNLSDTIQSIGVTMANRVGTSNSVSLALR